MKESTRQALYAVIFSIILTLLSCLLIYFLCLSWKAVLAVFILDSIACVNFVRDIYKLYEGGSSES